MMQLTNDNDTTTYPQTKKLSQHHVI